MLANNQIVFNPSEDDLSFFDQFELQEGTAAKSTLKNESYSEISNTIKDGSNTKKSNSNSGWKSGFLSNPTKVKNKSDRVSSKDEICLDSQLKDIKIGKIEEPIQVKVSKTIAFSGKVLERFPLK